MMDLNELRRKFREKKELEERNKTSSTNNDVSRNSASVTNTETSEESVFTVNELHEDGNDYRIKTICDSNENDNDNVDWNEACKKAINLLYQIEKCPLGERKESLKIIEALSVPPRYEAAWNQIIRIWKTFLINRRLDTKTLPNPDGVKYSQRPYPITGSSGVQDLIREIVKFA